MILNIPKRELHFAAYLKARGITFIGYKYGNFVFESSVPEVDLRVEHSNSEALKVDRELFTLKTFFNSDYMSK